MSRFSAVHKLYWNSAANVCRIVTFLSPSWNLVSWVSGKLWKIGATRCHILKLKCIKFNFGWGSAPDPAGGAYSAPPDIVAGFKSLISKRRGERREGKETEGNGRVREGCPVFSVQFVGNPSTQYVSNLLAVACSGPSVHRTCNIYFSDEYKFSTTIDDCQWLTVNKRT